MPFFLASKRVHCDILLHSGNAAYNRHPRGGTKQNKQLITTRGPLAKQSQAQDILPAFLLFVRVSFVRVSFVVCLRFVSVFIRFKRDAQRSDSVFGKVLRRALRIPVSFDLNIPIASAAAAHTRYTQDHLAFLLSPPPRHVMLPAELARSVPRTHLMTETEWRNMGVQQSPGWVHYMMHAPEPHVLLFRRPLPAKPPAANDANAKATQTTSVAMGV